MTEDTQYTDEEIRKIASGVIERMFDKIGDDKMKHHLFLEFVDALIRGDTIHNNLTKLFINDIMEALIDETLKLEKD